MRLLLTTDTVGGVWTFTKELAGGLLRRGCSVAMVSFGALPNADQTRWCEAIQKETAYRFLYVESAIPLEWMKNNGSVYSDGAVLMEQIAQTFQPDLLLSSQYCYGCVPLPIPRIVIAHSDVLSWAQACRAEGLPPSAWLDQYYVLVTSGLKGADAVIAPTEWMLQAIGAHFHLPASAHVIPNGRTVPHPSDMPGRKMQAITAGRIWDEAKNLQMLSSRPLPMPLLVAGDAGSDTSPLLSYATFLGKLDEASLLNRFRASAVYICCSRYEPFGLAPLEAALCGCAVLAQDIPSLREVWGDSALYFTDAPSLTSLLEALKNSPNLLARAQRHSFDRARRYSADRMVAGYLELMTNAVQGRRMHAYA